MKKKNKQRIRLLVLILIAVIILYKPISAGQIFTSADNLQSPLVLTLDGINYTFSETLTPNEFEKNGWRNTDEVSEGNSLSAESSQKFQSVLAPSEEGIIQYSKRIDTYNIYLTIRYKNNSATTMPYGQAECTGITIIDYGGIYTYMTLPNGIAFRDTYGKVERTYGKGSKRKPEYYGKDFIMPPVYKEEFLLYKFNNPQAEMELRFSAGHLKEVRLNKY